MHRETLNIAFTVPTEIGKRVYTDIRVISITVWMEEKF